MYAKFVYSDTFKAWRRELRKLPLLSASHKGIPVLFCLHILQKGPFFLLLIFSIDTLLTYLSGNKLDSIMDKVWKKIGMYSNCTKESETNVGYTIMAVLLAVALFSVMLAKGLSASPQHSRYFGLDLLLDAELLLDPGLAPVPWRDFMDSLPPPPLPFLLPLPLLLLLFWLVFS